MVAGGTALEEFAETSARRELAALISRTPRVAHRLDRSMIADVEVEAVRPGDLLLVKPGEIVPADGIVCGEPATLDESALTGEPIAVERVDGALVRSGALNAGRAFRLRATANAEHSTYAAIVRLVEAAERDRPRMVHLADRFALGFLGFTLSLCGLAWGLTGNPVRALAVLVVATPCPLILAAPVALVSGVSRAARCGVIVKGAGALERLARTRIALFDKTGTLTTGTPRVTHVEALDGFEPDDVLQCAASLEQASQHGVAKAIIAAARALNVPLTAPFEVEEVPGGGLSGKVRGTASLGGRRRLVGGGRAHASSRWGDGTHGTGGGGRRCLRCDRRSPRRYRAADRPDPAGGIACASRSPVRRAATACYG